MKKILNSGATLDITISDFQVSHNLFKAVLRTLKTVDISLGAKAKDLNDLFQIDIGDDAINSFKNLLASLLASDDIELALRECFKRATYNGQKIYENSNLYESESFRGDYLEISKEVLMVNINPFFKSLGSLLKDLKGVKTLSTPKSTLTETNVQS